MKLAWPIIATTILLFAGCYKAIENWPNTDDSGPDNSTASDADTDSDSDTDWSCEPGTTQNCLCGVGLEGIQRCKDDGSGWGPCECGGGDVDTDVDGDIDTDVDGDIDTDVDVDTDTDTDMDVDGDIDTDVDGDADTDSDGDTDLDPNCDPSYRYPATCIGNDCTEGGACCQGAICNYSVMESGAPTYASVYGQNGRSSFLSHYCFPLENFPPQPGITPCECGDVPTSFIIDDQPLVVWEACLATGSQVTTNNPKSKILSREYLDSAGGQLSQADITMCNLPTTLDGKKIPLTMCFGYEQTLDLDDDGLVNDDVILLAAQGQIGMTAVWIWQTIIPKERWREGTLPEPYRRPLDDKSDIHFLTSLIYGTVVGTTIDQTWLEGWAVGGMFTIAATGEICNGGACPKAEFGVDLDFVAIKAEIDMSED